MYHIYLWIGLIGLIGIIIIELYNPIWINEGFANLVSVGDSAIWMKWMPRRGDIGLEPTEEENGYTRDIRYFSGYTDVQRLGQNHDFCRMIQNSTDSKDMFFACALGGTEGLSSVNFRTPSTKNGFILSRDDYMNNLGEGRAGYCRIIKTGSDQFEAKCNSAGDHLFRESLQIDTNPPDKIKRLLYFYDGITFWLRFKDDIVDYAKNVIIFKGGDIEIDEIPKEITRGLFFNGIDQYLRIGDTNEMRFGSSIQLKFLRGVSFWVYFDEFTNNAKIFDFGNPNQPSVFCGIIGRGNATTQQDIKYKCQDESQKTIPDMPSGQQCVIVQSPQVAMINTRANIEEYDCPSPEIFGRIMPPLIEKHAKPNEASTADLLYEIWENKNRKLHIQLKNVFPLKKWVHIVITATNSDAFKPDLDFYQNGVKIYTEKNGWLPQMNETTNNYIGKSNTANVTSQMDNKDELFKGQLFDFRGYRIPINDKKVKDTYQWGKEELGLHND